MLEVLTPGATIILSACSCLLCLGFFWSLHVYFLPYLRQRRLKKLSVPSSKNSPPVDPELCRTLYNFPDLIRHCPRESLADCELTSSKWSATAFELPPRSAPLGPVYTIERPRPQRLTSVPASDLRRSLLTHSSLPLPTEQSCSTITTIGHADNAVPHYTRKYRQSITSFSEISSRGTGPAVRLNSNPVLAVVRKKILARDTTARSSSSKQASPTEMSFSWIRNEHAIEEVISDENREHDQPGYTNIES